MVLRSRQARQGSQPLHGHGPEDESTPGSAVTSQRPQQPQPASEPDVLPRGGAGGLSGSADHPETAGQRLGPVQDDTDLHTPIIPAPAAGNISQLADACDAGAATRYEHLHHRPQPPRRGSGWQTVSTLTDQPGADDISDSSKSYWKGGLA